MRPVSRIVFLDRKLDILRQKIDEAKVAPATVRALVQSELAQEYAATEPEYRWLKEIDSNIKIAHEWNGYTKTLSMIMTSMSFPSRQILTPFNVQKIYAVDEDSAPAVFNSDTITVPECGFSFSYSLRSPNAFPPSKVITEQAIRGYIANYAPLDNLYNGVRWANRVLEYVGDNMYGRLIADHIFAASGKYYDMTVRLYEYAMEHRLSHIDWQPL